MKSRVEIAKHALHPMLVVFPLGLLSASLVWDMLYLATDDAMWAVVSFWTILAGLSGGLLAAVPGFIDWLAIPRGTRARRVGVQHLIVNLTVVGLFLLSLLLRRSAAATYARPDVLHMVWGWIGVALAVIGGWLGGELVERHAVSVDEDAHLDAPSSLAEARERRQRREREPFRPRHIKPAT